MRFEGIKNLLNTGVLKEKMAYGKNKKECLSLRNHLQQILFAKSSMRI